MKNIHIFLNLLILSILFTSCGNEKKRKAGSTQEDLIIGGKLIQKSQLVKEKEIIKEYKVNQEVLDSIELEGLAKGWAFPK
jgi:hypothetical protein